MATVERQDLDPKNLRTRTVPDLARAPETERSNIVLTSDVEGPFFLGDFIAEAMEEYLVPSQDAIKASPGYGNLIYAEGWNWFTRNTAPTRRGNGYQSKDRTTYSLSQEGTDTIFTLPMLLAQGATYEDLERLTLKSKETPGAKALVDSLRINGVNVIGITTAPVEPYKRLFAQRQVGATNLIGSPFPIDETRDLLQKAGVYEKEVGITQDFLVDAYEIIDDHSSLSVGDDGIERHLTEEGSKLLQGRIAKYISVDLGVSYDFSERQQRGPAPTLTAQVIEASSMVGDRAKAALSQFTSRKLQSDGGVLVAMGDGANDAVMLQRAPISIGLNGADAARAAKISVVTADVRTLLPIFWEVANGARDIPSIVAHAQSEVGSTAIVTEGGPNIPDHIITEHKKMKKRLRGENITY